MHELQQIIDQAWEDHVGLSLGAAPARIGDAGAHVLGELDCGVLHMRKKSMASGRRTSGSRRPSCCPSASTTKRDFDGRVYIGQSIKIYDRVSGEVICGRIPEGSAVVAGKLPSADGKYSLYGAVIVKRVDAKTRAKTAIIELPRD